MATQKTVSLTKRIADNLYTHLYRADEPPVDQLVVKQETVKRDPENSAGYLATAVYITNINKTKKTHVVRLGFQVDEKLKPIKESFRYV